MTNVKLLVQTLIASIPRPYASSKLFNFKEERRSDRSAEIAVERTCKSLEYNKLEIFFKNNRSAKGRSREQKSVQSFEFFATHEIYNETDLRAY